MRKQPLIWIVENTFGQVKELYNVFSSKGIATIPTSDKNEFNKMLTMVRKIGGAKEISTLAKEIKKLEEFLNENDPSLVILDVALIGDKDDYGLKLLEPIRNIKPYLPILVLTMLPQDEIVPKLGKSKQPTFYLNKTVNEDDAEYREFINTVVVKVVDALIYWHDVVGTKQDILEAIEQDISQLENTIHSSHGLLTLNLEKIIDKVDTITSMTKVMLSVIREQASKDNPRIKKAVDETIRELLEDIPESDLKLNIKKEKIGEILYELKSKIEKAFKGEIEKDVIEVLKDELKTYLDVTDDKSTTLVAKAVWKAIGSAWRFYKTGSL